MLLFPFFSIINRVFPTHQYLRDFIHPVPEDRDEVEDLPRGQLSVAGSGFYMHSSAADPKTEL